MTSRVQSLLDFHATKSFGTKANLLACQTEARHLYRALTADEQHRLAEAAVSQVNEDNIADTEALCCLACFHPGSLTPFHERLVERRILYPGVIFHGAESRIAPLLIPLLQDDKQRNLALIALAWIGDETVQAAFANWRDQPPTWASKLHVPPHHYAHEAGWELTDDGSRRDLFYKAALPLVCPTPAAPSNDAVRIGVESTSNCPWCGRQLTALLAFDDIGRLLPNHGSGRVSVLTCDVCTCYGTVFAKGNQGGEATWHNANVRPDYLPPDSSDWDAFPALPLVVSGETRNYLESANWSMLPGVAFSQIGGFPTWVQDAEHPRCPDCSETMPFVGQISNEDFLEFAEGIYYAFHCPRCNVTATNYQQS